MSLWVAVTVLTALTCGAGGWWVGRVIERRRFDRLLDTSRQIRRALNQCTCPPLIDTHTPLACPFHNPEPHEEANHG